MNFDIQVKIILENFGHKPSFSLNDLRRLFDISVQGFQDPELLDEVYSQWYLFLEAGIAEIKQDLVEYSELEPEELETHTGRETELPPVLAGLERAHRLLDAKYTADYKEKLLALNNAIQVWHRDVPILTHYMRDYVDEESVKFLDWLQNRKSLKETKMPKTKKIPLQFP